MDVSKQVIEVLDHLSNKIGISIDWTQKNIVPQIQDFMNRYIQYRKQMNILWLIILFVLLTFGIFLIYRGFKIQQTDKYYRDCDFQTLYNIGGSIIIIAIFFIIVNIIGLIKLNAIPEMYFINLIKCYL